MTYLSSSKWESTAQTLVNTVNIVEQWNLPKLEYVEAVFEPQKQQMQAYFP